LSLLQKSESLLAKAALKTLPDWPLIGAEDNNNKIKRSMTLGEPHRFKGSDQ